MLEIRFSLQGSLLYESPSSCRLIPCVCFLGLEWDIIILCIMYVDTVLIMITCLIALFEIMINCDIMKATIFTLHHGQVPHESKSARVLITANHFPYGACIA